VTAKPRILLVDDRAENLTALEAILASLNHILVPVRSGDAALKALLTGEFAVILLDVVMPGMDGFETAAHQTAGQDPGHPDHLPDGGQFGAGLRVPWLRGWRR
jgi:CheY-like chemotaxis protein